MHAKRGATTYIGLVIVMCAATIAILIGSGSAPSEAQADYAPELCLTFSDPAPYSGDRLTITGCAEPSSDVAVLIDERFLDTTEADGEGSFATTVVIPPLEAEHTLIVEADGVEIGRLALVPPEEIILVPDLAPDQLALADSDEGGPTSPFRTALLVFLMIVVIGLGAIGLFRGTSTN